MRNHFTWRTCWAAACLAGLALAGCGASKPEPAQIPGPKPAEAPAPAVVAEEPAGEAPAAPEDGHAHADDGHGADHGHDDDHDHDHHHEPPRGGTMIELGDHVGQLEFVLDPESGTLTAYFMDGHAEAPVRMAMPALELEVTGGEGAPLGTLSLAAVASPLTGETVGDTSEFAVTADWLRAVQSFSARTPALTVRGVEIAPVAFTFNHGGQS